MEISYFLFKYRLCVVHLFSTETEFLGRKHLSFVVSFSFDLPANSSTRSSSSMHPFTISFPVTFPSLFASSRLKICSALQELNFHQVLHRGRPCWRSLTSPPLTKTLADISLFCQLFSSFHSGTSWDELRSTSGWGS